MNRDMELVRKLALLIRDLPDEEYSENLTIDGYDAKQIAHHCGLLFDSGMISGNRLADTLDADSVRSYVIEGLTSKGHDFVDLIGRNEVWEYVKKAAISGAVSAASVQGRQFVEWMFMKAREIAGV